MAHITVGTEVHITNHSNIAYGKNGIVTSVNGDGWNALYIVNLQDDFGEIQVTNSDIMTGPVPESPRPA